MIKSADQLTWPDQQKNVNKIYLDNLVMDEQTDQDFYLWSSDGAKYPPPHTKMRSAQKEGELTRLIPVVRFCRLSRCTDAVAAARSAMKAKANFILRLKFEY